MWIYSSWDCMTTSYHGSVLVYTTDRKYWLMKAKNEIWLLERTLFMHRCVIWQRTGLVNFLSYWITNWFARSGSFLSKHFLLLEQRTLSPSGLGGGCLCFNLQQERPRILFAPTIQHCSKRDLVCYYPLWNKNVSGCYTTNSGTKCSYGNGFHIAFRCQIPLMSNFSSHVCLKSNFSVTILNFKNTRAGFVPKLILSFGNMGAERVGVKQGKDLNC